MNLNKPYDIFIHFYSLNLILKLIKNNINVYLEAYSIWKRLVNLLKKLYLK
jgi:hypothetical protein